MSNIYVEGKGPKGPQIKESLGFAVTPAAPSRGLAVTYGSTEYLAALAAAAGIACLGLIEEDIITGLPGSIIEFGQAVAQIGANVTVLQELAANAAGQLVPATPGQNVVAISLENQNYVAPGSYACVFVIALEGQLAAGAPGATVYYAASGALAAQSGTAVLNGAAALAMTLAAPTVDGIDLFIVAETAHAHIVTTPALGLYNLKHIVTYAAEGDNVHLRSAGGTWMLVGAVGGPTPAVIS